MGAWFETVSSRVVHDGFSTVRLERVRMPDGSEAEREVVAHPDAAAVVPVTTDGDVLLLRQYRHPLGRYLLEIPAGVLDVAGEEPAEAARRELVEEVEHAADELEHLITFENSGGWTTERTHVYRGLGVTPVTAAADFEPTAEEADMEVVRIPLADAVAMAREGRITDAKTVVGLLLTDSR